jgi:hypothetical protein
MRDELRVADAWLTEVRGAWFTKAVAPLAMARAITAALVVEDMFGLLHFC